MRVLLGDGFVRWDGNGAEAAEGEAGNQIKAAHSETQMSAAKYKIRILIADDHPIVRRGLQSCLTCQDSLEVVGEASDGDEALEKALALIPDMVLLDLSMPRRDGLAVTTALRREAPQIKVLILSMHGSEEYLFRSIQAGAHGYVSKEASLEQLLRAIESVHSGETFFNPEIARSALDEGLNNGEKQEPFAQLTSHEREVLILIAQGQSNKEIANQLGIGVRPTQTHRARIMRRLDIHSVTGLTKFAIANDLVALEDRQSQYESSL